ncbi:hypothetical protein [Ferrimicrobium acidiphilum]|uniref:hypothetical protein n=1 Tax=Ferrimicrobium acidiphilum TaxID=121039 RepID=UPI0023F5828F|nr:hypothetical protein [Ferrimicrobium acidiphilum]
MTDAPTDPLVIIELTNLKAAGKLGELASHPQLGMKPEWIGELAADKTWFVRCYLAQNAATANSSEGIRALAADKDPDVRSSLAETPALANFPEIIQALANNPAIPSRTASTNPWQTTQPATQVPAV